MTTTWVIAISLHIIFDQIFKLQIFKFFEKTCRSSRLAKLTSKFRLVLFWFSVGIIFLKEYILTSSYSFVNFKKNWKFQKFWILFTFKLFIPTKQNYVTKNSFVPETSFYPQNMDILRDKEFVYFSTNGWYNTALEISNTLTWLMDAESSR